MVDFEEKERKIIITMNGDKEDYVNVFKSLVFLLGNQNPDNKLDGLMLTTFCSLLEDMVPAPEQLTPM